MNYPPPLQRLIDHFRTLPGVGPKTAARFAMALLQRTEDELRAFGHALVDLKNSTRFCAQCLNLTVQSPCPICANPGRDKNIICVVARPQDLLALESTGEYRGLYHVLHGTLNPIEGVTPAQLRITELINRIQRSSLKSSPLAGEGGGEGVREVILAFNQDMEGEATAIYLTKMLQNQVPKITRLARGLPMGGDLEYADEITLSAALKGRKEI